jgi:hypothetical protein
MTKGHQKPCEQLGAQDSTSFIVLVDRADGIPFSIR